MPTRNTPENTNVKSTDASDGDALLAAIQRDPEAAAAAHIAAVDRFLSAGCPLHPEPLRGDLDEPITGAYSAGINCHICNFSY